jgi:EmrB/QacA subfamily drug resistance transporter
VRRLTLWATALGSALAFLDTTVVIVALPRMEQDLGLGLAGQQWVVLAYSLALSSLYLVSGAVGDRLGLRRTFVVGMALFAAASLVCAAAPGEAVLVAGRALQGIGGAALTTTSLALLRVVWAGEAGRAIGLWTSLTSVATIGGPVLGGVVVEAVSWRWIFLVNLPLAAITIALALAARSDGEAVTGRATLDVTGSALAAIGLAGVSYALVEASEQGAAAVVPAALVGAGSLGVLALWTLRSSDPVVPPRLLRRPGLLAANVVTLVMYGALSENILFWPVFLQFLGLSPVVAGLAFTLPSLGLVLLAPRYGRVADRHGPRWPIAFGAGLAAVSFLLLHRIDGRADVWTWGVAATVVFALGLPAVVAPITAAAIAPSPPDLAGVATGLNQTAARAGGVVAVAAVGALAGWVFAAAGGTGSSPFDPDAVGAARDAGVDAFHATTLATAALAATAALLAATILPRTPIGTE